MKILIGIMACICIICIYISFNEPQKEIHVCKKSEVWRFIHITDASFSRKLVDVEPLDYMEDGYVKIIFTVKR